MRRTTLLASAATHDGLIACARRYIANQSVAVVLREDHAVVVNGRALDGIRWRLLGRRYRLEAVEPPTEQPLSVRVTVDSRRGRP